MPFSGPDVPEKPEVAPDANASGGIAARRDRLPRSSRSPSRLNAMHTTTATLTIDSGAATSKLAPIADPTMVSTITKALLANGMVFR
jgi:hypothetical protein